MPIKDKKAQLFKINISIMKLTNNIYLQNYELIKNLEKYIIYLECDSLNMKSQINSESAI